MSPAAIALILGVVGLFLKWLDNRMDRRNAERENQRPVQKRAPEVRYDHKWEDDD